MPRIPRPRLRTNTQSNAVCVYGGCLHTGRYAKDRFGSTVCANCRAILKNGKWSA